MAHLEQLKQHEQALRSIYGIVRTMKTLAAVNVPPYEQAAQAIEAYHHSVRNGFAAFAFRNAHRPHGADKERNESDGSSATATGRPAANHHNSAIIVAFGSDHGFCGNYNEVLATHIHAHCRPHAAPQRQSQPRLLCVGARLEQALAEYGLVSNQRLMPPASVDGIARLADDIVRRIEHFSHDRSFASLSVSLAWTTRGKHGRRSPSLRPLLPLPAELLKPPARWPSAALPSFSLPAPVLLAALVRQHIFASVFRAAAEAIATENAARLALMQQAEQNVEERLSVVRQDIARQRQDEITNELMDIISGHEP